MDETSPPARFSAEQMLRDTPYLVPGGSRAAREFGRALDKSGEAHRLAVSVGSRIQEQASAIFESFGITLRSELVAESNQMEHYHWTAEQVREVVMKHRDLLEAPVHNFLAGIQADSHAYQALGLYKAQSIADEWARSEQPVTELDVRQLHWLITQGENHAGRYKLASNKIAGADHVPPAPADAAEEMRLLTRWLQNGTGDPALDATVVHAWLVHLHPFEDGNGRMARLLANLALSRHRYPPLIISASADRGEYYDALAKSDEGDILPLFVLFSRILRRTVRTMGRPDYVENVIRDRILVSRSDQQMYWQRVAGHFLNALRHEVSRLDWRTDLQGYPGAAAFRSLAEYDSDGNSWFVKIADEGAKSRWLLWFGYNTLDFRDTYPDAQGYPSIFFSLRDEPGVSGHPYRPVRGTGDGGACSELVLIPGRARPVLLQEGWSWREYELEEGARRVADSLRNIDSFVPWAGN